MQIPPGLGKLLKARSNVVHTNAEGHVSVLRHWSIIFSQALLYVNRTFNRVHGARELGEQTVSGRTDDPAPKLPIFGSITSVRSCVRRARVPASSADISVE